MGYNIAVTTLQMQKEIVAEFKRYDVGESRFNLSKYLGTQNKLYYLKSAQEKKIAKEFLSRHKDINEEQFLELLDALYAGESFNERTFGTKLLEYKKSFKPVFTPQRIFNWLGGLSGWCEVDSLCQSSFTSADLLSDWASWEKTIDGMSRDANISRRRASLVLLVKSVRESNDPRLLDLSFKNLERLKGEKDILVSKAVSWLLRSLIKNHMECVRTFLSDNEAVLPKFVIKEVSNKLTYGTKSRRLA
jgi:3-methyladenine DNA glycosylase AlkD